MVAGSGCSPLLSSLLGQRNRFTPSPRLPSRAGLCWSVLQQRVVFAEQVSQWPSLKSLRSVIKSVPLVLYSLGLTGRYFLRTVSTSGMVGARAPSSGTIVLPALWMSVWVWASLCFLQLEQTTMAVMAPA